MKKYHSLALICALALTLTGCKSQSTENGTSGAASAPTAEAIDDINAKNDVTSAAQTSTTEATTVSEPQSADPVGLQSYTVDCEYAQFTFDAPEGLEFDTEASSVGMPYLFEGYAFNDDDEYTIGVMLVDFDYTLGQPQELLDFLDFPNGFGFRTEFSSETTENGTAYDLILMDLYDDQDMQEYYSTGVLGCFPMNEGVLFFGYELFSQEYYYTAQQTIDSLVISESGYTQPDTELSGEFQTIVCEEPYCTFPVLKEFEYWEDGDDTTTWSGMTADYMDAVMAGYEADVYYKDIYEEFTYETDTQQGYTVLSSDYMQTYDGKEFGFAEMALYSTEGTWDFTSLYAMYAVDGGTYLINYTFTDECDEETKALVIESFKGFKITAPDVNNAFCKVSAENCSFHVLNGFWYFCDGIESEDKIWQGLHDNNMDHFFAYHYTHHSYEEELADQKKTYMEQTDSIFSIEYDTTYNGTEFTVLCQALYEDEEQRFADFIAIGAMYPAEDGFYALEYWLDENNSQQFLDLIHESFKSFEISE